MPVPPFDASAIPLIDSHAIALAADRPRRRLDEEELDALAHSIERHGLLAPILVRDLGRGRYELLAGERRLKAHALLGRRGVPAIVTQGSALELSLAENTQRARLDALELCDALTRLQADGAGRADLARLIGRSRSVVGDLLSLAALPDTVKTEYPAVRRAVPRSLLVEIVRARDPALQAALWEEAKAGTLTVRAARQRRRAVPADTPVSLPKALAAVRRCAGQLERLEWQPAILDPGDRDALRRLRGRIDALLGAEEDEKGAGPARQTDPPRREERHGPSPVPRGGHGGGKAGAFGRTARPSEPGSPPDAGIEGSG